MSSIASILMVALVSQALPGELEEQREFEAALLDSDRLNYVRLYVRENQHFSRHFMGLVANAIQSENEEVSRKAIQILESIGPQAADYDDVVLPFLAHEGPSFRIDAINCLGAIRPGRFYPEIARLAVFDEDDGLDYSKFDSVHHDAIRVLAKSESLEAVPYILAIYIDADTWRSSEAIRQTSNCPPQLQEALIPGLVQLLGRQEMGYESLSNDMHFATPIREIAVETLGDMGELPLRYLAEIEQWQALEEDPKVLLQYAVAIVNIGGHSDKQIEIVRSALVDSKDPTLQYWACYACIEAPLIGDTLVGDVVALAASEEPSVREAAAEFFLSTTHTSPEIVAALDALSVDYDATWTCWHAFQALANRGEFEDGLKRSLAAMEAIGDYELEMPNAANALTTALGQDALFSQIEAEFTNAEDHRRDALIMLLDYAGGASRPDLYERLLARPMNDEQRESLESFYEYALILEASGRVSDWRLPELTEEPAP